MAVPGCDRPTLAADGWSYEIASPRDEPLMLTLEGELDIAGASTLRSLLRRAVPGADVLVDMTAVTFIDGSITGILVEADAALAGEGGRLRLHGLGPDVTRVLRLAAAEQLLPVDSPDACSQREIGERATPPQRLA